MPDIFTPAIVIPAYNRPRCLQRLLDLVAQANYPNRLITLIISIDPSPVQEVLTIAQNFNWKHGYKNIITHQHRLGLKNHILCCGSLTAEYESIILLEDDLLVSPFFYEYAIQSLSHYVKEDTIAGISLYNYQITENGYYPFAPIDDGSDVYFIRTASSWGQVWTKKQWAGFEEWLSNNPGHELNKSLYPKYLSAWSEHSWKKHFISYMIEAGLHFVFPRLSLTTNPGETGTNALTKGLFQVPLQMEKKTYRFVSPLVSKAMYDAHYEIEPDCLNHYAPHLKGYNYTVDLYGTKQKEQIQTPYVLTSKPVSAAIFTYGQTMFPNVLNVIFRQEGKTIKLARTNDVQSSGLPAFKNYYRISSIAPQIFGEMQQFPSISIIIPILSTQTENLINTISSLTVQNYPNLQLIFAAYRPDITKNWFDLNILPHLLNIEHYEFIPMPEPETKQKDSMIEALNRSKGLVTGIALQPVGVFQPYSLSMLAKIFSRLGDVNWILTTRHPHEDILDNRTSLPKYRWTRERFDNAHISEINTSLNTGFMVWKTFLWKSVEEKYKQAPESESFNRFLCRNFFEKEDLFTVLRPMYITFPKTGDIVDENETKQNQVSSANPDKVSKPFNKQKLLGKLFKPFYLADIPYLRYLYISLNNLPKVIRHHPDTDSYYLSDY